VFVVFWHRASSTITLSELAHFRVRLPHPDAFVYAVGVVLGGGRRTACDWPGHPVRRRSGLAGDMSEAIVVSGIARGER